MAYGKRSNTPESTGGEGSSRKEPLVEQTDENGVVRQIPASQAGIITTPAILRNSPGNSDRVHEEADAPPELDPSSAVQPETGGVMDSFLDPEVLAQQQALVREHEGQIHADVTEEERQRMLADAENLQIPELPPFLDDRIRNAANDNPVEAPPTEASLDATTSVAEDDGADSENSTTTAHEDIQPETPSSGVDPRDMTPAQLSRRGRIITGLNRKIDAYQASKDGTRPQKPQGLRSFVERITGSGLIVERADYAVVEAYDAAIATLALLEKTEVRYRQELDRTTEFTTVIARILDGSFSLTDQQRDAYQTDLEEINTRIQQIEADNLDASLDDPDSSDANPTVEARYQEAQILNVRRNLIELALKSDEVSYDKAAFSEKLISALGKLAAVEQERDLLRSENSKLIAKAQLLDIAAGVLRDDGSVDSEGAQRMLQDLVAQGEDPAPEVEDLTRILKFMIAAGSAETAGPVLACVSTELQEALSTITALSKQLAERSRVSLLERDLQQDINAVRDERKTPGKIQGRIDAYEAAIARIRAQYEGSELPEDAKQQITSLENRRTRMRRILSGQTTAVAELDSSLKDANTQIAQLNERIQELSGNSQTSQAQGEWRANAVVVLTALAEGREVPQETLEAMAGVLENDGLSPELRDNYTLLQNVARNAGLAENPEVPIAQLQDLIERQTSALNQRIEELQATVVEQAATIEAHEARIGNIADLERLFRVHHAARLLLRDGVTPEQLESMDNNEILAKAKGLQEGDLGDEFHRELILGVLRRQELIEEEASAKVLASHEQAPESRLEELIREVLSTRTVLAKRLRSIESAIVDLRETGVTQEPGLDRIPVEQLEELRVQVAQLQEALNNQEGLDPEAFANQLRAMLEALPDDKRREAILNILCQGAQIPVPVIYIHNEYKQNNNGVGPTAVAPAAAATASAPAPGTQGSGAVVNNYYYGYGTLPGQSGGGGVAPWQPQNGQTSPGGYTQPGTTVWNLPPNVLLVREPQQASPESGNDLARLAAAIEGMNRRSETQAADPVLAQLRNIAAAVERQGEQFGEANEALVRDLVSQLDMNGLKEELREVVQAFKDGQADVRQLIEAVQENVKNLPQRIREGNEQMTNAFLTQLTAMNEANQQQIQALQEQIVQMQRAGLERDEAFRRDMMRMQRDADRRNRRMMAQMMAYMESTTNQAVTPEQAPLPDTIEATKTEIARLEKEILEVNEAITTHENTEIALALLNADENVRTILANAGLTEGASREDVLAALWAYLNATELTTIIENAGEEPAAQLEAWIRYAFIQRLAQQLDHNDTRFDGQDTLQGIMGVIENDKAVFSVRDYRNLLTPTPGNEQQQNLVNRYTAVLTVLESVIREEGGGLTVELVREALQDRVDRGVVAYQRNLRRQQQLRTSLKSLMII